MSHYRKYSFNLTQNLTSYSFISWQCFILIKNYFEIESIFSNSSFIRDIFSYKERSSQVFKGNCNNKFYFVSPTVIVNCKVKNFDDKQVMSSKK